MQMMLAVSNSNYPKFFCNQLICTALKQKFFIVILLPGSHNS